MPTIDCSPFRPITLLNVDYKIVAKILPQRLKTILSRIINPDQAGFVKSRYGIDKEHVLDIVHCPNTSKNPVLRVSLDDKKAFDRVDWTFQFLVMENLVWALISLK